MTIYYTYLYILFIIATKLFYKKEKRVCERKKEDGGEGEEINNYSSSSKWGASKSPHSE